MEQTYLFFDLDGTLTDSSQGITNSVAYALEHYGIHVEDKSTLRKFIGPPLRESYQEYYGFDPKLAQEAVWKYREYFDEKGIFENRVYDGIPELLAHLQKEGKSLIVATSKPVTAARMILDHFGLSSYFQGVYGSELDGRREKKEEVIRYALKQRGITDMDQVLMVGDRSHDVLGAAACGIRCVGILYGFGDRKELEEAKAFRIAATIQELEELLLNGE